MDKTPQRPFGEVEFFGILTALSVLALIAALRIAPFTASGPSAVPVISTGVMVLCALLCFVGAIRARLAGAPKDHRDGLITLNIALVATVFAGYVAIFDEAGFLLATALFLFLCIALLRGASPGRAALIALVCVAVIYAVFRMVFLVLLPEGVVPEREIIQGLHNLFGG